MDSAGDIVITINQLANRLENSTVSERIDALQELQRLARSNPDTVGAFSLKKVLDYLQEQSSAEEYQEALDLIYKLVKSRDKTAAKLNTDCILAEIAAVELLLDLLEHQDPTVGVMSSQILSVLHANNGKLLESQIQECPDGMNKLLQRLPDSSREEVRNEAIVLIQQLTSKNEEMKKTVVFNDGFEILFRIIQLEGGHKECGLVISSCLHICSNILNDSETCQRLFFAMGGDWILQLANFFDPCLLENLEQTSYLIDESDEDTAGGKTSSSCWFDDANRLLCAILAMNSLFNSLSTPNPQHCVQVATATSVILPSIGHWIARRGPAELVNVSLALLKRIITNSGEHAQAIGNKMAELILKVSNVQPRKNFPPDLELPSLSFGWRPIANDERRLVALLSLLAERYVYPAGAWQTAEEPLLKDGIDTLGIDVMVASNVETASEETAPPVKSLRSGDGETFAVACISVFECIINVDANISDFIVQHVLAPPPPPAVDGFGNDSIESSSTMGMMRPLGALIMQLLIDGCQKVMDSTGGFSAAVVPIKGSNFDSMLVASRAANLLTVIFLSGSQLAKELVTAVTTLHIATASGNNANTSEAPKSLLLLLLSAAGRAARLPQGGGYSLLISILRTLATISSDCELASRQMLEDPSNLFVVDIATSASEAAGVPATVQIIACLFLGCCFQSMPAPPSANVDGEATPAAGEDDDAKLNRKSFLAMIDSRIGLNRFTDILKRPLVAKRQIHSSGSNIAAQSYASSIFITDGFKAFYERQVDAIRTGLFDFYTGSLSATGGDIGDGTMNAAQQQVIEMQKERIAELEAQLQNVEAIAVEKHDGVDQSSRAIQQDLDNKLTELEYENEDLKSKNRALEDELNSVRQNQENLHIKERHYDELLEKNSILETELTAMKQKQEEDQNGHQKQDEMFEELNSKLQRAIEEKEAAESSKLSALSNVHDALQRAERAEAELLPLQNEAKASLASKDEEILDLKQKILDESASSKLLRETLDHRERKIELLLEELKGGSPNRGGDALALQEQKVADLENRNSSLKQQLWEKEAELESVRAEITTASAGVTQDIEASPKLKVLIEAVLSMVSNLDIDIDDFDRLKIQLDDNSTSLEDVIQLLDYILNECCQKINSAVGECSDIAEGAGLYDLAGSEGSVERFVSCCRLLRKQLQDLSGEIGSLSEYQQRIADLELLYGESENMKAGLIDRIDELEKQLSISSTTRSEDTEVLAELELLKQMKMNLEEELAHAKEQIRKLEASSSHTSDEQVELLHQQLQELEVEKSNATVQLSRVQKECEELKIQLEDSKEKIKVQHETSEEELSNVNMACDVLQERLDTAQEQIDLLKAEVEAAKVNAASDDDTVTALQCQLDAQAQDLQNVRVDYNTLAEECDALKKEAQHMDEMRAALEDAESKRDSLEVVTHHLQHELEQSKKAHVENATNMQRELSEVRLSLEQAEAKRDSLEVQVKHLQHQLDLSTRMGDQSNDELQQELQKISAAKVAAEIRASTLENEATTSTQQLQQLQSDVASQKNEKNLIEKQLKALSVAAQSEIALMQDAADAANIVIHHMADQIKLLKSELSVSIRKGEQLQKELINSKDELNKVLHERSDMSVASQVLLEQQSATHNDEIRKIRERSAVEVNALSKNLTAAEEKLRNANEELKALEAALMTERGYLNEAERKADSIFAESTAEIEKLKSQNQQLTSTMEDLATKITTQDNYISDMYAQQAKRVATEQSTQDELCQLRKAVQEYEEQTKLLEAEKLRVEELLRIATGDGSGIDAFHAQEMELQRITKSFEQLSRDLCAKDQQLQHVTNLLQRREGEAAGVMATMDGIKMDLELLREENAQLNDSLAASQRQVKDAERELKVVKSSLQLERSQGEGLRSQLQSEKHRHRSEDAQAAHNSDIIRSIEAQLKDVISWLVKTHHIDDYTVTNGKGDTGYYAVSISTKEGKAIVETSMLIETVRNCVFWIQRTRDSEIRAKNSLLHEKERELNSTKRSLQTTCDQLAAARRDVDAAKAAASAAEAALALSNRNIKDKESNIKDNMRSSSAPATPNRTANSLINNSAAKEAARLNSELMKEKRKMSNLQQQHSDLLALLAQQEVELNVFRTALEKRVTSLQLQQLQDQAQQQSIELYGTYTNFR